MRVSLIVDNGGMAEYPVNPLSLKFRDEPKKWRPTEVLFGDRQASVVKSRNSPGNVPARRAIIG